MPFIVIQQITNFGSYASHANSRIYVNGLSMQNLTLDAVMTRYEVTHQLVSNTQTSNVVFDSLFVTNTVILAPLAAGELASSLAQAQQ